MPKDHIPGFGWFAIFKDPAGLTQALYEALPRPPAARAKPKKASARKARKSKGRRR